ncbi:glycosyl transferase family 1, partial [Enterococcus faecium]|nr:glycosyl transferase family 1 [Enterococcus faecium]
MKILIVVTMTNNFGKKGSYNSQEIGLARGLAELGHEVIVYKSVKSDEEVGTEQLSNTAMIHYIKCRYVGSNGFLSTKNFDKNADVLIQFADLQ